MSKPAPSQAVSDYDGDEDTIDMINAIEDDAMQPTQVVSEPGTSKLSSTSTLNSTSDGSTMVEGPAADAISCSSSSYSVDDTIRDISDEALSSFEKGKGISLPQKRKRSIDHGPSKKAKVETAELELYEDDEENLFLAEDILPTVSTNPVPQTSRKGSGAPRIKPARDSNDIVPFVIAYDKHYQGRIKKLSFGVQWEIARLISCKALRWEDIELSLLDNLEGTNDEKAAKTAFILKRKQEEHDEAFSDERAVKYPWAELDREEEALQKDPYSGLGYDSKGVRVDLYGGKVHFRAKFNMPDSADEPNVTLERAELGSSALLPRRYGSKSFIRIKIPKKAWYSGGLKDFFRRPFVIMGHVYRAYWAHELHIYLFKTNETYDGDSRTVYTLKGAQGFSLLELFEMFNPLESNSRQTMAKWVSRMQLGCSNSVPGVLLEPENIHFIGNIESCIGSDMTDGCGYCSRAVMCAVYKRFGWQSFPNAIQVRVAGCKGLLVENPANILNPDTNQLWLRDSQRKIRYVEMDRCLYSLDIVRSSHLKTPARLNYEVIINLSEGGVGKDAFEGLIRNCIRQRVDPLLRWEGPNAMPNLWAAVAKAGGVLAARRSRAAGGESRALGLTEYDDDGDESEDDLEGFDAATHYRSEAWAPDRISGQPSSLEETVMVLLDSGFTPMDLPILRQKHEQVIRRAIESSTRKYRIEVPMSLSAFIIPDPYEVLAPGEIYVRSAEPRLVVKDGTFTDLLLGDVLITRSPCKLPTDVQKWKAVDKPELRHITNVIVMSVKGSRRQADYLAGGDYDGDKCLVIWDPCLVTPYTNADLSFAEEPPDLKEMFDSSNTTVTEFLRSIEQIQLNPIPGLDADAETTFRLQHHLLGALDTPSDVGKYDSYFVQSLYTNGYKTEETKRLAYIFCKVLDGAKTGLRVKQSVKANDDRTYGKSLMPEWHIKMNKAYGVPDKPNYSNRPNANRSMSLGAFIMDQMREISRQQCSEHIQKLEELMKSFGDRAPKDADLSRPWEDATRRASALLDLGQGRLEEELELIRKHVTLVFREHREEIRKANTASPSRRPPSSPKRKKTGFTEKDIVTRQDTLRLFSKRFNDGPAPPEGGFIALGDSELARVRASYAYVHDWERSHGRKTRFSFDVAMGELCAIKAKALGPAKMQTIQFYELSSIKPR